MDVRNAGIKVSEKTVTQDVRAIGAGETGAVSQSYVRPLPSFFIIGPPRTGTSWLHEVLSGSTVLPHPTKETRFFDRYFHRGIQWYLDHFPASNGSRQPVGEVAPTYFASDEARERIAHLIPNSKVVCIFRNPVERVLSLYRLKRAYAMLPWSFEEAIIRDPELLQSASYVANFVAWQRALGAGQVLATVFDDLQDDPQSYVDALADFIGIPRFTIAASLVRRVNDSASMTLPRSYYRTRGATVIAEWCKARRLDRIVAAVKNSRFRKLFLGGGPRFTELPQDAALKLWELFRPEVKALEVMLNRDLSAWKPSQSAMAAAAGQIKTSAVPES